MVDSQFPPKNRRAEKLPVLRIEVEHAGGVEVLNPNTAIILVLRNADGIRAYEPVPGEASDISDGPAILYRCDDLEIRLTPSECLRLLGTALRPDEYFALRDRYGMAYEWHEDFYHPETGEAFQSREEYFNSMRDEPVSEDEKRLMGGL